MFEVGQKVVYSTASGGERDGRVICTDRVDGFPVVVLVESPSTPRRESVISVRADGKYWEDGRVIIKPAPVIISSFRNVLIDGSISCAETTGGATAARRRRQPTVDYRGVLETVYIDEVFDRLVYHPDTEADKPAA